MKNSLKKLVIIFALLLINTSMIFAMQAAQGRRLYRSSLFSRIKNALIAQSYEAIDHIIETEHLCSLLSNQDGQRNNEFMQLIRMTFSQITTLDQLYRVCERFKQMLIKIEACPEHQCLTRDIHVRPGLWQSHILGEDLIAMAMKRAMLPLVRYLLEKRKEYAPDDFPGYLRKQQQHRYLCCKAYGFQYIPNLFVMTNEDRQVVIGEMVAYTQSLYRTEGLEELPGSCLRGHCILEGDVIPTDRYAAWIDAAFDKVYFTDSQSALLWRSKSDGSYEYSGYEVGFNGEYPHLKVVGVPDHEQRNEVLLCRFPGADRLFAHAQ